MTNPGMASEAHILQDLYDSEISFEIAAVWDSGFSVRLGDRKNGFDIERSVRSYASAVEQLRGWALEHYPESAFARKYRVR